LIKDDFTVRIGQGAQSLKTMTATKKMMMMMMMVHFIFDPLFQMTERFVLLRQFITDNQYLFENQSTILIIGVGKRVLQSTL
jgi:hypothetical protein